MQSFCPKLGFDGAQSSQVVLAVDEALANVMKHGYQGRDDGRIFIRIAPFQDSAARRGPGVRIVIEDEARQVGLDKIKSRDLDDVRPGGLGVHIIQRVMDEARYEHREGGVGMRLTLVKHVSSPAARGDTLGLDGTGLDVPGVDCNCDGHGPGGASA
jgi:anti-sigma regulatory factor (Ser/Thr protein kinase)